MLLRLCSIALPALALAACGSSDTQRSSSGAGGKGPVDAGTGDTPAATGTGGAGGGDASTIDGRILFRGLGEGIAFEVDLYASPVPAPAAITRGDGHCDIHPVGEGDDFEALPPPGTLDLGASVTAQSGATSFTSDVEAAAGTFQYAFSQAGVDAFDKTWTLRNSGSATGLAATTLATAHVPASVVPIVPAPMGGMVDTTSGQVTLQWSGGQGAETFHVNIMSSKAEVDCYPAPTATSFDLPMDVIAALDPQVTPNLWAESVTIVEVGQRRVWVRVTSDNLD